KRLILKNLVFINSCDVVVFTQCDTHWTSNSAAKVIFLLTLLSFCVFACVCVCVCVCWGADSRSVTRVPACLSAHLKLLAQDRKEGKDGLHESSNTEVCSKTSKLTT